MTDTQSIESVREHIAQLAREIEEYSNSDVAAETFFRELLKRLVLALGARAGAIWMLEKSDQAKLFCDIGLAESGFYENPRGESSNQQLIAEVVAKNETQLIINDAETQMLLPTPHLLILGPLERQGEVVGLIEIFQRTNSPVEAHAGYISFLDKMCAHASNYLTQQAERESAKSPTGFWMEFELFVLQLQKSLDIREVAQTATNDGRLLIGCDRLSLVVKRGKSIHVESASGQATINRRSNLNQSMKALATKVIEAGETITSMGTMEELPPQIQVPMTDFLSESGSRIVMLVPLFENEQLITDDKEDEVKQKHEALENRKVIGCLVVEQMSDTEPGSGWRGRTDLVAAHISASLSNALTFQNIFLMAFLRKVGRAIVWFKGRRLVKALLILAALIAVCCAFAFVPADYRVEAEGQLMPVIQDDVFAPWDGEVVEIFIEGGQRVKAGQPLLRIQNDQLRADLLANQNQLNEKLQLERAVQAEYDSAVKNASKADQIQLEGRILETRIEIEGLVDQLRLLKERDELLNVRSPIDGVIATFQVELLLKDRPVRRGEILLEILDDSGPWHLELSLEEHRLGHLLKAQIDQQTEDLPVEFQLATAPELTYEGSLKQIGSRTISSEEKGTILEVQAKLNVENLPYAYRRIGADVQAKINCGEKSLFYVLFGDVVEFFQKTFWL